MFDWCKFSYISYDASPYENKIYEKFYIRNFNHVKYTCTCQTSGRGIPTCAHTKIIRTFILKALHQNFPLYDNSLFLKESVCLIQGLCLEKLLNKET